MKGGKREGEEFSSFILFEGLCKLSSVSVAWVFECMRECMGLEFLKEGVQQNVSLPNSNLLFFLFRMAFVLLFWDID